MSYRKRGHRRVERDAEINIVPLLDVLLVLLLVFMATAPIISQSVQVELPQSTKSEVVTADKNSLPVVLEVSGVEEYVILINNVRKQILSKDDVILNIQTLLKEKPDTIFLIGGAKEVPYDEIIKALNLLKQAGVSSVGLMTKPLT